MLRVLHNFFIPHPGNDHKPHALRPRALTWYAFILIGIKAFVTIALFAVYPDTGKLSAEMREEIISLINMSRASEGLPPVTPHPELNRAAQEKARDMLERQYFSHTTPEGTLPWELIDTSAYPYAAAGENLAIDFVSSKTVHEALMASKTHRDNILNARFSNIGIGVVQGKFQGRETYILVEFFAAPKQARIAGAAPAQAAEIAPEPTKTPDQVTNETEQAKQKNNTQQTNVGSAETAPKKPPAASQKIPYPPVSETVISVVPPSSEKTPNENVAEKNNESNKNPNSEIKPTMLAYRDSSPSQPAEQIPASAVKKQSLTTHLLYSLSQWSRRALYAGLLYLTLALLITIVVRIRIQHAPVIAQTFLLILALGALLLIHIHTLERLTNAVKIL